jgi:dCTP deaminase
MMLSGLEIDEYVQKGKQLVKQRLFQVEPYIIIDPYEEKRLNPNSYNLRLSDKLLVNGHHPVGDTTVPLDMKVEPVFNEVEIPESGLMLSPGGLYLGSTVEYTESHGLVPRIDGRSSVGRLGICVHVTAGFGDVGFCGTWTLEITCVRPVRIYPNVEICQISYETISSNHMPYDSGKYQHQEGPKISELWKELA